MGDVHWKISALVFLHSSRSIVERQVGNWGKYKMDLIYKMNGLK